MKKKVLILGSSGLLGRNLCLYLNKNYEIFAHINRRFVYFDGVKKFDFNFFNKKKLKNFLIKYQPNIIINCTGITNVEECEKDKFKAYKINVGINDLFSSLSLKYNFKFISISSDHLYGNNNKKFSETDLTKPLNYYAYTKIKSENKILKNSKNSLILRTNFFGNGFHYRQSFSDQIIEKLNNGEKLFLFKDVFFNPVLISELAKIMKILIQKNISGILNISSDEKISKYKFGLMIEKTLNLNPKLIKPITFSSKKKLRNRPKNMTLDNSVLKKVLNVKKIS